jgi:hypothetical protein
MNIVQFDPAAAVAPTPMEMLDRAIKSGASIEVLTKLMDLQERWERRQARKAFDEALSAAKSEIPVITKNRQVEFDGKSGKSSTNYKHEDLAEIARTVDPILGKHGLSFRFRTTSLPNEPITVTCIVSHKIGHSEENTLCAGRDDTGNKNSIQALGSTLTYLQRYALKAALGLAASNDDDGMAAGNASKPIAPAPASVVPPHDPATVEILREDPHTIALPEADTQWRRYVQWGSRYIAAIGTARTAGEIDKWQKLNAATLTDIKTNAVKIHDRIALNVEAARKRLAVASGI